MAKDNSIAIIAIAAAAGGAFFLSRQSKAASTDDDDTDVVIPDTDKDPKKDPKKDPDVPDEGKAHATIGKPYVPGDEAKNIQIAVSTKPLKHPVGLSKGTRTWKDWLTNIAFWETFPSSPIVIPKGSEWAAAWIRINKAVGVALTPTGTTPKGHPTIGTPYKPGRASVQANVVKVVELRPTRHPAGGGGLPNDPDWLTNVVYWESFPLSPVKIESSSSPEAKDWKTIKAAVVKEISRVNKTTTPKTDNKKTDKKTDKKTELSPTLGQPYRPGSDQELGNAAIAVRTKPSHHPRNEARKPGQAEADWLTNIAFWESWPAAPTKLDTGSLFIPVWKRIKAYVLAEMSKPVGQTKKTTTPTKKTTTPTKKTTTPTKKTTTPSAGGTPGDLSGNARIAIAKAASENDRANSTYWMTYPDAPHVIPKGDKKNAALWLKARDAVRRALATPATKTTPTTKTTTPSAGGTPGDLSGNARIAIAKATSENDRANSTYWMTYPDAPHVIPKGDKKNAALWLKARDAVRAIAGTKVSGAEELSPPAFATLEKSDQAGAKELAEASRAVVNTQPGPEFTPRATESALRRTYPNPRANDAYKAAAARIMAYVQRAAKIIAETPEVPGLDGRISKILSGILANSSQHRTPTTIHAALEHATQVATKRDSPPNIDPVGYIAQIATAGEGKPLSRSYWAAASL